VVAIAVAVGSRSEPNAAVAMCSSHRPNGMRARLSLLALLLCAIPPDAVAFSSGSPVCEVNALPLVPMSPVLIQPPPAGWRLVVPEPRFHGGRTNEIRVVNADPAKRARGVLLFAKSGPLTGAGRFILPSPSPLFGFIRFVPGSDCGEWAVSHVSAEPKTQGQLVFRWQPDAGLDLLVGMRAFVIEDCLPEPGGCRGAQALTDFIELVPTVFFDDFEAEPN